MFDETDAAAAPAGACSTECVIRNWSARTSLADLMRVTGATEPGLDAPLAMYFATRRVRAGGLLVCAGQDFHSLYVVLAGTLRVSAPFANGVEHVVAFPMTGDVVGFDALADRKHATTVRALDDVSVAVVPYGDLQDLRSRVPQVEEALLRAVSGELRREHLAKSNMGTLGAEMRLVHFLLQLSDRFARLGYSPRQFRLRMTREDIASYLGLSLETVCRAFTQLARLGLIAVDRRDVTMLDAQALRAVEFERPEPGSRKRVLRPCVTVPFAWPAAASVRPQRLHREAASTLAV